MARSKGISRAEYAARRRDNAALVDKLTELRQVGSLRALAIHCEILLARYEKRRAAAGLPRAEDIDWPER